MAVYRYPPEVHELVKEWCAKLPDTVLAEYCNEQLGTQFTAVSMKAFRGNHGYRNYQPKCYAGEEYWKHQKRWPQGMYEYIRDNSWGVSSSEMAERVNAKFGTDFTPHRMKVFRARWHIKSGVKGWYQKGHTPGNKGRKQNEYCSPEAIAASSRTRFRKGHRPANELPVGTVTHSTDGYLIRKKSDTGTQWERWEFVHRVVWEEHNGPIPAGMCVTFKDGNRDNVSIDNLMLVTQAENRVLTRWGYRSEDPELTAAGAAVVRLKIAANKRRRKK